MVKIVKNIKIKTIDFEIPELRSLKKYPKKLYYIGNIDLLKKPKISIVGSRRPNQYAKRLTYNIAKALSLRGVCIVSGAAMGVDRAAHLGSGVCNTIATMGNGLDIRYPSVNKNLIADIEQNGLVLSQFEPGFKATPWSFVVRNEVVVALGDALIVTQADLKSGSLRSVEYALEMEKKIFVLSHRVGESEGTNYLVKNGLAEVIYDVEEFASKFGELKNCKTKDDFLEFCKKTPLYEEAVAKYGSIVFEYELSGKIDIKHGKVYLS
jgi:DNA processing protein